MIAIIVLIVILIPVIGFYGTQAILNVGRAKDVKLPNLVGKTIEEAEQEMTSEYERLMSRSADSVNLFIITGV